MQLTNRNDEYKLNLEIEGYEVKEGSESNGGDLGRL